MKKICLIFCMVLVLTGCGSNGKMPGDLTVDRVRELAAADVDLLNAKDYDALFARMTPEMTEALTQEEFAELWEGVLADAGEFTALTKYTVSAKDGYAGCRVQVVYENGKFNIDFAYDGEERLAGMYF